ncbi:hypothetical protein ACFWP5_48765 [Streptomyces sp. NPDC058469]|uniref:hypothetical protein n=1 Tax=Streptomyces sp. NPDC058469 TaxID=3346514 RepID=UPI003665ABD3
MAIAVVRAETFYTPPPGQPADLWAGVLAAELVWRWYEFRVGRRAIPPADAVDDTYFARINQNRWLADCSSCGSAQIVSPSDPRYACVECGWGWCALVFPDDVASVEAALMGLKPALRNWWNPADPNNPDNTIAPAPDPGQEAGAS